MTTVPPASPDETPVDPASEAPASGPMIEPGDGVVASEGDTSPRPPAKPKTPAKPRSSTSAAPRKKPAPRAPKPQSPADSESGSTDGSAVGAAQPAAKKTARPSTTPRAPRSTTKSGTASGTKTAATPGSVSKSEATVGEENQISGSTAKPAARKTPAKSTGAASSTRTSSSKTPARKPVAKKPATAVDAEVSVASELPEASGPSTRADGAPIDAATNSPVPAEPSTVAPVSVSEAVVPAELDVPSPIDRSAEASDVASIPATPKKKPAARKPASTKAPRARVAASVAKSPSEVVEHAAPKLTIDASQIPPVPPLPVVPPVPPLPDIVPPEKTLEVTPEELDKDGEAAADVTATRLVEARPEPEADAESMDDVDPVSVSTPSTESSLPQGGELPPLPDISAEEAALQFETLPDAAEQATGLESHEPMKFVWSKRWPFLSLIPATTDPRAASSTSAAEDNDGADINTSDAEVEGSDAVTGAEDDAEDSLDLDESLDSDDVVESPMVPSRSGDFQDFFPEDTGTDGEPLGAEVSTTDNESTSEPFNAASPLTPVNPVVFVEPTDVGEERDVESDERFVEESSSLPVDAVTEILVVDAATEILEVNTTTERIPDDTVTDVFADSSGTDVLSGVPETELLAGSLDETVVLPVSSDTAEASGLDSEGESPVVLSIRGLSRSFGDTVAVDGIDLEVREGSFYGIVGPNGAGKTTTLSMITGLLRPDSGHITVHGIDVWENPDKAKRSIGVLPDRLRLFDRLTGAQLLYYSGVLRGLDGATVRSRVKDLAVAFGLEDALNRLVTDYSAGMTKKVALASAMIHSPRLLVLDEPFESVDPVSAANVIEILQKYVAHGGTVVLSSHGMDLIQRVCDHVAIIVNGQVLAAGAVDDVRGNGTLEDRFVELAGGRKAAEGMEWLHSFSD